MEELKITPADGQNGTRILHLEGPLTLRTVFDFQATARQEGAAPMIVDVAQVPYMDSAGLGAILGLLASAQRRQLGFAVAGASERILTLFQVTHVEDVLPHYATTAEAEASLAKAATA